MSKIKFVFCLLILTGACKTNSIKGPNVERVLIEECSGQQTILGQERKVELRAEMDAINDSVRISIENKSDKPIFLFTKSLTDPLLSYTSANLYSDNGTVINLNYRPIIPHPSSYYSGMRQYQFLKIGANSLCKLYLSKSKILTQVKLIKNINAKARLTVCYLDQLDLIQDIKSNNEAVANIDLEKFRELVAEFPFLTE